MGAVFGPAGNSESFNQKYKSTVKAPEWLKDMGLTAYEYQCGHGVVIGQDTARRLGELMARSGIRLSLHAPYYIVLTNPDSFDKNVEHLRKSCRAARWMGAGRVVVHTGFAGKDGREAAFRTAADTLTRALEILRSEGYGDITLCPEVMGKISQLGTLEEVLELCALDRELTPCVDFGHLYARTLGEFAGEEHFTRACEMMEAKIGLERARRLHIHFSRIEYRASGEYRHLTLEDKQFGPDFGPLASVLKPRGYEPVIICESRGTQAEDACRLRDTWEDV
ncbi:MAG: TIM barrel protein [Oscillospiraceae bacterium]|nr:TIM barrel protein [Oscillospiraceae bacterium]